MLAKEAEHKLKLRGKGNGQFLAVNWLWSPKEKASRAGKGANSKGNTRVPDGMKGQPKVAPAGGAPPDAHGSSATDKETISLEVSCQCLG